MAYALPASASSTRSAKVLYIKHRPVRAMFYIYSDIQFNQQLLAYHYQEKLTENLAVYEDIARPPEVY